MNIINRFYQRLLLNYLYGTMISLGSTFIGMIWLNIPWNDRSTYTLILIFSISGLIMSFIEIAIFLKQTKRIRDMFLKACPSKKDLEKAYIDAHYFPKNSGLRILGPRFVCFFVPSFLLIVIAKSFGFVTISYFT